MDIKTTYDTEDTIRIESTVYLNPPFSDSESKTDPETVTITITNPDDIEEVSKVSMTKDDTGEYYYNWNTDDLSEGYYLIEIYAERTTGESEIEDFHIKLE